MLIPNRPYINQYSKLFSHSNLNCLLCKFYYKLLNYYYFNVNDLTMSSECKLNLIEYANKKYGCGYTKIAKK